MRAVTALQSVQSFNILKVSGIADGSGGIYLAGRGRSRNSSPATSKMPRPVKVMAVRW